MSRQKIQPKIHNVHNPRRKETQIDKSAESLSSSPIVRLILQPLAAVVHVHPRHRGGLPRRRVNVLPHDDDAPHAADEVRVKVSPREVPHSLGITGTSFLRIQRQKGLSLDMKNEYLMPLWILIQVNPLNATLTYEHLSVCVKLEVAARDLEGG